MLFFGVPIAAWVCVASAAVVAAYLYRRRSHVVDVPAVVIWNRLGQPVDVRSIASLARRLLSLAAQLFMLALFAMALRESSHVSQPPRRWIIIVDQGATMQTQENGGGSTSTSRFEVARQAAKALL